MKSFDGMCDLLKVELLTYLHLKAFKEESIRKVEGSDL
jgi:hypothetical protein